MQCSLLIAFASQATEEAADEAGDENDDIYRIDADGTGPTRLTDRSGSDQHPDWSPVP